MSDFVVIRASNLLIETDKFESCYQEMLAVAENFGEKEEMAKAKTFLQFLKRLGLKCKKNREGDLVGVSGQNYVTSWDTKFMTYIQTIVYLSETDTFIELESVWNIWEFRNIDGEIEINGNYPD